MERKEGNFLPERSEKYKGKELKFNVKYTSERR